MKDSARSLLRDGTDLLARLDATTRESSQLTTRVRVDRLLESACPAVGRRYWGEMYDAYVEDVSADENARDEDYDEFFSLSGSVDCDCHVIAVAPDGDLYECDVEEVERHNLCNLVTWPTQTPNNIDVIRDPELWDGPENPWVIEDCRCSMCQQMNAPPAPNCERAWVDFFEPLTPTVRGTVTAYQPSGTMYVAERDEDGNLSGWQLVGDVRSYVITVDDSPLHLLDAEVDTEP